MAWTSILLAAMACGDDGGSGVDTESSSGADVSGATSVDASTTSMATSSTDATTTSATSTSADTGTTTGGPGSCGDIPTFEDGKSPSTEIFVAPDGSDTGGCGTMAAPCGTLGFALDMAVPGTAVRLLPGTHAGGTFVGDLAGTEDAPIWIGGVPGMDRPVIDGGGTLIQLSRVRYVIIHDLEGANATDNGINCDDGAEYANPDATRFVVFRDLHLHDIGSGGNQDCLKLSGLDDYWVLDSEFAACGGGDSGSAIDHVGCHRGIIGRNYFHDLTGGGNAVQCKGGSEDIEIRGNLVVDGGQRGVNMGGSTGDEFFRPPLSMSEPNAEARDIRVVANVFVGGVTPLAYVGCIDCLAANNTIVAPENWLLRILQEKTTANGYEFLETQNGRFINNIVVFDRSQISTYVNIGANTMPDTFEFTTNAWFATDDPGQSDPSADLPVAEQGGIYGMDPGLTDPAGGDYSIDPSGPAAGAGTTVPEVPGDRDGQCYADPPSLGAHEPNPP